MTRHGRKYVEAAKLVETERRYPITEAAELLPKVSFTKFDATVEAHLRLGVDPRHADQLVRGTVVLPHGTGRQTRVVVFAQGEKAQEALRAGADEVGADDLVKRVDDGWFDFDIAIATPDMMGAVGRLGRKLGPRGLMPNPKSGTVTFDIERAVGEVKSGRVEFKVDRAGIVHVPVGKASFTPEQLSANIAALVDAVNRAKPSGAKGTYLRSLTVAPSYGARRARGHPVRARRGDALAAADALAGNRPAGAIHAGCCGERSPRARRSAPRTTATMGHTRSLSSSPRSSPRSLRRK